MRNPIGPIGLGAVAAALALSSIAAQAKDLPRRPAAAAPSAERYGVAASYRSPTPGRGYSARARHMADCLATYRSYDPNTDRVVLRGGATRRCGL
jgi:hypothetical protein